jgi:P27 family predicted phage terminase small subunit
MRGRKPEGIVTGTSTVLEAPRAPAWLAKHARAEWKRVSPILTERRTLTDADLGCLEAYCAAVGLMRLAQKTIDAEGLTMGSRKHPAVAIQADAMTQVRQLAAELGLTPVSRSRPAMRDDDTDQAGGDLGL